MVRTPRSCSRFSPLAGNVGRRAEEPLAAGDIEEGFIETQGFDERREGKKDLVDAPADVGVVGHADRQDDGLRAKTGWPRSSG